MTVQALRWFEDDNDPRDLVRWISAAALVVAVHIAVVAGYLLWRVPEVEIGDDAAVISIELTAPVEEQVEQTAVEKPTPQPEVMPNEEALPEEKPPPTVAQASPATRTTERIEAAAPRMDPSWQTLLVKRLYQFMTYPSRARARNEQGVGLLAFTVDRSGHVVERHVVRSSGHPDLDAEMMALIERAQPLPAFPASMTQDRLDLTVPIRFSLR
jgi:protein TonB